MTEHISVEAQRLPGIGWRYSVPAGSDRQVTIAVEDGGTRHLAIVDPSADHALSTVRLSEKDAGVVAALLTGARFHLEVLAAASGSTR
jgi:K+/H+ antiporter YhaU regulatory subunit KhtT